VQKTIRSRTVLIKRWGGVLAGVIGAVGLGWYIMRYSSELYRLREISIWGILLLSTIVLIGHLGVALKLRRMVDAFNVRLSLWEAFLLTEAGGFLNIVPLYLGTGFRAIYLKKIRKLEFADFSMGFLGALLSEFMSAGLLGILFYSMISYTFSTLYIVFIAYMLVPLALLTIAWIFKRSDRFLTFTRSKTRTLGWFGRLLRSLASGLDTVLSHPEVVFHWFLLNILTGLVLGTRYWLIGAWLGYSIDFASGMVLQSASRAVAVVTIMPSGTIGLREALTGLGAMGLGVPAAIGVMISTIDRIVATAWIVFLGSISLFILRNRIARAGLSDIATEPEVAV